MRVLHFAPHPDDEVIGAPGALMALVAAGHDVTNFTVALGRPDDRVRRRAEVREACQRAGFEVLMPREEYDISSGDDLARAEARLADEATEMLSDYDLAVSPSPHDRHHGHEVVGRAVRSAAERAGLAHWWMWSLWGELALPTTVHQFGEPQMQAAIRALSAHSGELARNDYTALLPSRATANRILAAERVFGFGSPGLDEGDGSYAELLTEVIREGDTWKLATPHRLNPRVPLGTPSRAVADAWLDLLPVGDLLHPDSP